MKATPKQLVIGAIVAALAAALGITGGTQLSFELDPLCAMTAVGICDPHDGVEGLAVSQDQFHVRCKSGAKFDVNCAEVIE